MDKNTVIGLVIILLIILGFGWLNKPSEKQLAAQRRYQDSIAQIQADLHLQQDTLGKTAQSDSVASLVKSDSTVQADQQAEYGNFASAAQGNDSTLTIDTKLLKLGFSTKGGFVSSVELKKYKTYDSLPLFLFTDKTNSFNVTMLSAQNRIISTKDLYFVPSVVKTDSAQIVTMRLEVTPESYLDFVYTIPNDNYMISYDIKAVNMSKYLDLQNNSLDIQWKSKIHQQEESRSFEERYATLNYKYTSDDMETLNAGKNDEKQTTGKVRWVAFKDRFFSSVLISDESFTSALLKSEVGAKDSPFIKNYSADLNVDFDPQGSRVTKLNFYFGPNQYSILRRYDRHVARDNKLYLDKLVPLGWALFRWITQILVIPMFNIFGKFVSNYGIVILLMTLVIKIIILPFTYKSYMSSAKMRVLKPQIDEINAKIPAEKAMERQKATMELYKRVGVSPMSGCLPMLFQMPLLFAMFSFFPSAIELRQQSFLWAHDLSNFDAIVSWHQYIPFITNSFGNHISLFGLLMTVTNIFYNVINTAQNDASNNQMPGMKWMMYLMPLMFLFMFNNYPSGLSYYYFISLLISIGQTYLFRLFIDEDKLLAQLNAKQVKPSKRKKSGFMERLEAAQRQQQKQLMDNKKRK